jgi:hypothetical protein
LLVTVGREKKKNTSAKEGSIPEEGESRESWAIRKNVTHSARCCATAISQAVRPCKEVEMRRNKNIIIKKEKEKRV